MGTTTAPTQQTPRSRSVRAYGSTGSWPRPRLRGSLRTIAQVISGPMAERFLGHLFRPRRPRRQLQRGGGLRAPGRRPLDQAPYQSDAQAGFLGDSGNDADVAYRLHDGPGWTARIRELHHMIPGYVREQRKLYRRLQQELRTSGRAVSGAPGHLHRPRRIPLLRPENQASTAIHPGRSATASPTVPRVSTTGTGRIFC